MNNVQQETMNVNPDVLVCVRAANALLRENRIDEAKVQVEQALKLDPNNTTMIQLYKQITLLENSKPQRSGFEQTTALGYELKSSEAWIKKTFLRMYNSFEKARQKGEKCPGGGMLEPNEFFAGKKKLWEEFAEYLNDKTCLEIGSGPAGSLAHWWWVKQRIIIDPLIEKYKELELKFFNKTWFTDEIKLYARCAEEFIPELSNSIDGVIVCRNALDHCEDPMLVLQNIAKYARPGCCLLLWTDIWHTQGHDDGHRDITKDKVGFEKTIVDLGFEIFSSFDTVRPDNITMEYGCRAIKRG